MKSHYKTLFIALIFSQNVVLGNVIDLAKWTLQDPINGSKKVRSNTLVNENYRTKWFKQNGNSIRLVAPKNGKTSGSDSIRSELIAEYGNGDNAETNKDRGETWRPKDKSKNKLTFKVKPQKALDGRVYINQIHTKNSGKRPLLMALWDEKNKKITLEIKKQNKQDSKVIRHDIEGIKRNKTYEIRVGIDEKGGNNCLFYYVILGGTVIEKYRAYFGEKLPGTNDTLSNSWLDDECYFKLGAYNKSKKSSSTPGGGFSRVELYGLETTHY